MAGSQVRWFLTLAFGLVPLAAPAATAPLPGPTIEQLIKDGARYQGRTVRIRGQLDNCYGTCKICPEGTVTQTFREVICLSLLLGPQVPGDGRLSRTDNDLMTEMYRFAVVTVEARFTADCIFGRDGKLLYLSPNTPCRNQGPPDLSEGRVMQVHARKTVLDGLVDPQWIYDELVTADPDEREAILAEWNRVSGVADPEIFTVKDKEMAAAAAVDGSNHDGLACWCNESSCDGKWPTHLVLGMNSPANPFYCWIIKKTADGWRVLREDTWAF